MRARKQEFSNYMKEIAELDPLGETEPRTRLELFEKHFGSLDKLDREFLTYMRNVR